MLNTLKCDQAKLQRKGKAKKLKLQKQQRKTKEIKGTQKPKRAKTQVFKLQRQPKRSVKTKNFRADHTRKCQRPIVLVVHIDLERSSRGKTSNQPLIRDPKP